MPRRTKAVYPSDLSDAQWNIVEYCGSRASGGVWTQWALTTARTSQRHLLRAAHRVSVALSAPELSALDKRLFVFPALERERDTPRGHPDKVVEALRVEVRKAQGRKAQGRKAQGRKAHPTAAVIDTQSVKTTEKGGLAAMTGLRKLADASG